MRRPHELTPAALIDIVDALQQALYLEAVDGVVLWNPAKPWSAADALDELAIVLATHGLVPEALQGFTSR